jgi:hypothetical protein
MRWLTPLIAGAAVGITMRLLYSGTPDGPYHAMMRSFVLLVPVLVGAVAVYIAERDRRRSWTQDFWIGAGANALFVLGTLAFLIEGLICAVVALPLLGVLGGLAGIAMGIVCRSAGWSGRALLSIATLPLMLGAIEQRLPLPQELSSVERTCVVAATPEAIWSQLLIARDIRAPEIDNAWMYRIGVPLPSSAVTQLSDGTAIRHITMGKGIHFDQIAADWEPNHRVRWLYHFSADSFPPHALDDHVRIGGRYFDLIDTEYSLRTVREGTELRVRMTYRVSTAFNWYARPLARFFVGNFEEAALAFYAHRAERTNAPH